MADAMSYGRGNPNMPAAASLPIRRARVDEAVELSAIAVASKATWCYPAAALAGWHDQLTVTTDTIAGCPAYVIEEDLRVRGFYVLLPALPHWELDHFWVAPAAMRRGVGRALLAHAAGVVARGGATGLAIDADPHAEAFYLACGAQRVGAVAAPIPGFPDRTRPQLLLNINSSTLPMRRSRL